jgi:hypothetical protein
MFAVLPRLGAQLPDQTTEVHLVAGEAVIEWFGHGGRTYFLQISDDIDPAGHLKTWLWAAAIESGNEEFISYEFGGDTSRGFARLQYTDEPKPAGVELEDWDIDGDGLSNFAELTGNPQAAMGVPEGRHDLVRQTSGVSRRIPAICAARGSTRGARNTRIPGRQRPRPSRMGRLRQ